MKIAVLNSNGVQSTRKGKIQYYYAVDDGYNFGGNSATDVTNIEDLKLFHDLLRLNYNEYRDSLVSFVEGVTFSSLSNNEKKILAKNFAVDKSDRDSVLSTEEQEDFASDVQRLIDVANKQESFESYANTIAAESGVPAFTNSTTSTFFGSYVAETSSEGETTTSEKNTYQIKLNLVSADIPAGKYRISWNFEFSGPLNSDIEAVVNLNDSKDLMEMNVEMKNVSNWSPVGGFKYENLDKGTHSIKIKFKAEKNNSIKIRRARLELMRIS